VKKKEFRKGDYISYIGRSGGWGLRYGGVYKFIRYIKGIDSNLVVFELEFCNQTITEYKAERDFELAFHIECE